MPSSGSSCCSASCSGATAFTGLSTGTIFGCTAIIETLLSFLRPFLGFAIRWRCSAASCCLLSHMKLGGVSGNTVTFRKHLICSMQGSLLLCVPCIAFCSASGFTASFAASRCALSAPRNCIQSSSSALHAVATEDDIITDWAALDAAIATGDGDKVSSVLHALKEGGKATLWDSVTM
jgi:hypothetical protein